MRSVTRSTIVYKLPTPFVDTHKRMLDAVAWGNVPPLTIILLGQTVMLEAVPGRRGDLIVRAATPKSAIVIRRYANTIAAEYPERYPQPGEAEIAITIEARNPALETQD